MDLNTFFMVCFSFGCAMGLVLLVLVVRAAFSRQAGEIGGWTLRGAGRTIVAVAKATISEGIRTKMVVFVMLLIVAWVVAIWFNASGDGTIKGRVQMFMTYSLGFTGFVLSLLTILFGCRSLSAEITQRQIYGIVSKPVPRWQILAGKWVGVMTLNVAILGLVCVATYGGTMTIVERFRNTLEHELVAFGGLTPAQASSAVTALDEVRGIGKKGMESPIVSAMCQATGLSKQQLGDVLIKLPESTRVDLRRSDELRRQVLVARSAVSPTVPEDKIAEEVERRFQRKKEQGNLPLTRTEREIRDEIRLDVWSMYCTLPPGAGILWRFEGPKPDKGEDFIMSLRFKIHIASNIPARRHPETGQLLEEDTFLCLFGLGDEATAEYYPSVEPWPVRSYQEVEIPSDCVSDDGSIMLAFLNMDPRGLEAVFDLPEALQILYRVGTFEKNLFQACLAMLLPISCLASFSVCASTFLSFPVGSLIVICLFVVSASMGFVADSLAVTEDYAPPNPGFDYVVRKATVAGIGWALSLGDLDPVGDLMDGRVIGWPRLWKTFWKFALLKGGATMFAGVIVFRRRELAAVVV